MLKSTSQYYSTFALVNMCSMALTPHPLSPSPSSPNPLPSLPTPPNLTPPHPQVVKVLLSHGMDCMVPDSNGWLPFCYALWRENIACVLELLRVSDSLTLGQFGVRTGVMRWVVCVKLCGVWGRMFSRRKKDKIIDY
jgi:Ankyrin repeats (many copies)